MELSVVFAVVIQDSQEVIAASVRARTTVLGRGLAFYQPAAQLGLANVIQDFQLMIVRSQLGASTVVLVMGRARGMCVLVWHPTVALIAVPYQTK